MDTIRYKYSDRDDTPLRGFDSSARRGDIRSFLQRFGHEAVRGCIGRSKPRLLSRSRDSE